MTLDQGFNRVKEEDILKSNLIFAKQKMKNQDSILRPRILKLKSERLRFTNIVHKRNLSDTQEWWNRARKEA
jgi:hypothetical protein